MFDQSLRDKRVLVTQADVFMGPMLCEVLAGYGAKIMASTDTLMDPDAPASIVAAPDPIDILIADLAIPALTTMVTEVTEQEWHSSFTALVDPLPRLFKAVLPQMIERRAGKILVMYKQSVWRSRLTTFKLMRLRRTLSTFRCIFRQICKLILDSNNA